MALANGLTPKQDAFAMAYVETSNATEAYKRAYNAQKMSQGALEVEACRLAQHPKVALRIEHLQQRAQVKHEITVDRLTEMTLAAYDLAMKEAVSAPSAAVKASEFLGKLHGLVVEKKEITGKDGEPLMPSVNLTINRRSKAESHSTK